MNILKSLFGSILAKAMDEIGLEIDQIKAAQFVDNVLFERITEEEWADWLDEIIKGKKLGEPLTDIAIYQAINEARQWAKEKLQK